MGDDVAAGLTWLADQLKSHASRSVTYVRGATSLTLQATVGRSQSWGVGAAGGVVASEVRDYLVAAADLTVGEPRAGDRIVDAVDGATFEVLPTESGRVFEWLGPRHLVLRVHTKQVS